jgi:MGT family glycosyltransferase
MARILVCTHPITGHLNPALAIIRALVARGHEVRVYTGKKFRPKVEAAGAGFAPMTRAYDYDDGDYDLAFPGRVKLDGLNKIIFDFKEIFARPGAAQREDLLELLAGWPADLLLSDPAFVGAKLMYELGELPVWAVFNISVLGLPSRDVPPFGLGMLPDYSPLGRLKNRALALLASRVVFRSVNQLMRQERARLGLAYEPIAPIASPMLYLQPSVPEIEYPRGDLIPSAHFIGALIPPFGGSFTLPPWWDEVTSGRKPVVLLTQGTVATRSDELIAPTLQALAAEDLLVVATVNSEVLNNALPRNVRATPFIPFDRLMPHVSAMVTNGGYGGVTIALANGVPVVCSGITEDKPEVGNRVAYVGVGVNLKTNRPSPERLRTAVRQVLDEAGFRQRAQRVQAAYARHNAPEEAALLLERLLATRRPVLRETNPWHRAVGPEPPR